MEHRPEQQAHTYPNILFILVYLLVRGEGGRVYVEVHETGLVDVGREGDGDLWIRKSGAGGRGSSLILKVQIGVEARIEIFNLRLNE